MGYETHYKLHVCTKPLPESDPLVDVLGEKPRDYTAEVLDRVLKVSDYNPFEDRCKWYDHENVMKEVSKRFPGVLLVLSGVGEEYPDIWRKYFLDGKMVRVNAELHFPRPSGLNLDGYVLPPSTQPCNR